MNNKFINNLRLFLTAILILPIISICVMGVTDSNGVWHLAKDVRGGTFGEDEQELNMFYKFINPVYFMDKIFSDDVSYFINISGKTQLNDFSTQKFISNLFSKAKNRFVTGLVLGLMPCGMVIAAMMAAATANTYAMAGMAMAAFGVGTIPALVVTALGGQKLQQKFPSKIPAIRAGLMIWSGVWLFAVAGMMVLRG